MGTRAKDIFLRLLTEAGVDVLFGNPGTTEFPLMDALADVPELRYYLGLHDAVAVGMAHGHTLVTGRPAAVNLHAGPGVANAMGNLYNAYKSGVPLIVTAGQVDTRIHLHEPPLWADTVKLAATVTKWAHEVTHPAGLPHATWRALTIALTPPVGPVFLSLPADVLDGSAEPVGVPFSPPARARMPSADAVSRVAEALQQAKRPVLVVGDGVAKAAAADAAVRLAETAALKVLAERIPPTIAYPTTHPLYFGTVGASGAAIAETLQDADVLIIAGASRLVPVVRSDAWVLSPHTTVIQIDEDPWELGKVFPYDLGIFAGIRETLDLVNQALDEGEGDGEWRQRAAVRRESLARQTAALGERRLREACAEADAEPIAVSRVVRELQSATAGRALVFDESLTSTRVLLEHHSFPAGGFYGIKGTCLGWGLPAAVGAQLAAPDRPTVAFVGDGAAMYSFQALWSAVHYDAAVTVIVVNNRSYKILKEGMRSYRGGADGPYPAMDLDRPAIDYVALAQSMGMEARRVVRSADLEAALDWALGDGPTLLEVLVDPSL